MPTPSTAPASAPPGPITGGTRRWTRRLGALGPLLALALLVGGTGLVEMATVPADERAFFKPRNLLNIVSQSSYTGIVAVGMTFVIALGAIDLSVGSMLALAAGVGVMAMNGASEAGAGPVASAIVGVAAMLGAGAACGLANGLLVTLGRLAPFIATLGTMAAFRSIILASADGGELRSGVRAFGEIAGWGVPLPIRTDRGVPLMLTAPTIGFVACVLIGQVVLWGTVLGRHVLAVGGNPVAARYAGVPVRRVTAAVFTIAGLCCGLAAVLNASRMNSVSSSTAGVLVELDAIAAVVIGGTRLQGGGASVLGTFLGVLILGVISNMLTMLDVSDHLQGLVKGCIIVAAVLVQRQRAPG